MTLILSIPTGEASSPPDHITTGAADIYMECCPRCHSWVDWHDMDDKWWVCTDCAEAIRLVMYTGYVWKVNHNG